MTVSGCCVQVHVVTAEKGLFLTRSFRRRPAAARRGGAASPQRLRGPPSPQRLCSQAPRAHGDPWWPRPRPSAGRLSCAQWRPGAGAGTHRTRGQCPRLGSGSWLGPCPSAPAPQDVPCPHSHTPLGQGGRGEVQASHGDLSGTRSREEGSSVRVPGLGKAASSLSCGGERRPCDAASGVHPVATRGRCRPGRGAEGRGSHAGAGVHGKASLYLEWAAPVIGASAPTLTA